MENKHRCRELGPAKMQKTYHGVDSNDIQNLWLEYLTPGACRFRLSLLLGHEICQPIPIGALQGVRILLDSPQEPFGKSQLHASLPKSAQFLINAVHSTGRCNTI
jgi:hypothetical protein